MRVRVRVYMELALKVGWREKEVLVDRESTTLEELLKTLPELAPFVDNGFTERFMVLVNGVNSRLLGSLRAKVKDGDVIDIFPPAGGG